ncbi:hypothetical protein, partial [Acinetobacter baumannii]|uniref:hypothetical protein n=1 Tax=Acinetobacter baumannii TaxID=470 RepID=UPI000AEC861B
TILSSLENHLVEIKDNKPDLEGVLAGIEEINQQLTAARQRPTRQRPQRPTGRWHARRNESQAPPSPPSNETAAADIENANPLGHLLGNIDFTQIMKLLQDPKIQSLLKGML